MQTPHLEARYAASALQQPRIGLIVPRHKHSAVDRNRLRRRLRELIRLQLLPNIIRGDALIRANAEAYDVSYAQLRAEIDSIGAWNLGPDRA
jgi:ribonuclease P protein component